MKATLALILILSCCNALANDQQFIFNDTFRNLDNIPVSSRPDYIFNSLWDSYEGSVKEINKPIAINNSSYGREQVVTWITTARYSRLLETMLELKAFTVQNRLSQPQPERMAVVKQIDSILQKLKLHYEKDENVKLTEFCNQIGVETLEEALLPLTKS